MKILYIESKLKNIYYKLKVEDIAILPKKLFLAYSIQYKKLAINIKEQLIANNIEVKAIRQVFGCSKINTKLPVLFIGTGVFHVSNLFLYSKKIFLLDLLNNRIDKVSIKDIENLRNKRKSALLRFLSSENIGIIVTTKRGQSDLKSAMLLKEELNNKGKNSFIFLSNNIDVNNLENFNIDSWINTACPGLSLDNSKIINYYELDKF